MFNSHVRGLLVALIAVVTSFSISASDSMLAMLRTAGEVTVNGVRSERVSALLPRDVVQTTAASSAAISLRGTVIRILPKSTIIWGEVVEVQAGSIEVGTMSGMAVTSRAYRFVPLRKDAKFTVSSKDACSYISVQEGLVKAEGGSKSVNVSSGGTFFFGEQKCGVPNPGGSGGKSAIVSRRTAIAVGGVGDAAIVTGLAASGRSCSPSSPD